MMRRVRRVGIDLALTAPHRATVYEGAEQIGRPFRVPRTLEGIDLLERRATAGAAGPCEFIMEPTGLAWLPIAAELARRGHRVFVPKAQKTSALRRFLAQYAKTDTTDARAQALVRHVDPKGVHPLPVPTAAQTTLRLAIKQRSRLVVEAVRAKNRIRSWLVLANPDVCDAFGDDPFTEAGVAFLRRYVDPERVRELGQSGLGRFFGRHAHRAYATSQVEAVWQACLRACELFAPLRAAGRLPFDYEVLQAMVCQELERIDHLAQQVAALDQVIARAYAQVDPERVLEREVPGVGPTIAPTIEGLVGDVERFGSVKRFAAFFGLVPRARQTGGAEGKPRQPLTKGGQALLKQYMFLAAETARRSDPELAQMYARMLAGGKHHYVAAIAVAHKLVRKIYALLKLRAEARRAEAEGRPAPAVRWRYRDPETACTMTAREARAWVAAHYPSQKKRAAEAAARTRSKPQAGSSEDATNVLNGAPPTAGVAGSAASGKGGENPVEKPSTDQARIALDGA